MTKTYDFDAWYDENENPGPKTRPFRFGGRLWQIPVDPPAAPLLRMQRAYEILGERDIDASTPLPADIADMMSERRLLPELVGQDLVDQWIEAGATMRRLSAVTWRLWRHYAGLELLDGDDAEPAADAEGEASAPTGAETSSGGSSTTGPS